MAVNQYVLQDRTLATKWALKVADTELFYQATGNSSSAEPILEDDVTVGTYWRIFIDDGELATESVGTVQDDAIQLIDSVTSDIYKIIILDEQVSIQNQGQLDGGATFSVTPSYAYTERISQNVNIVEFESGKEKRMKIGTVRRAFTLRYDKATEAKKDSIVSFFDGVSGSLNAFNWTNPFDNVSYLCRLSGPSFTVSQVHNNQFDLQLQFIEDI